MPDLLDGPWWTHRDCRIVVFSGHRNVTTHEHELLAVELRAPGAIWLHGGARGFDAQVAAYAEERDILTLAIKPDYENYPPKQAPMVRNYRMLELADMVVLCYDDRPNGGTAYVFRQAAKRKLPILRVTPRMVMRSPRTPSPPAPKDTACPIEESPPTSHRPYAEYAPPMSWKSITVDFKEARRMTLQQAARDLREWAEDHHTVAREVILDCSERLEAQAKEDS